jgi:hypothetical protein
MSNRKGETITTAVTNMDLHDIARSCRTYDLRRYFVMTPILDQHALVQRIIAHWKTDTMKKYHPDRFEAFSRIELAFDFKSILDRIEADTKEAPEVVLTDARVAPHTVSYADYRAEIERPDRTRPVLLVFGTGWGVSPEFYPEVHVRLEPIFGRDESTPGQPGPYNHLSVRSAVAIILDRLLSVKFSPSLKSSPNA